MVSASAKLPSNGGFEDHFIVCSCTGSDHVLRFFFDKDSEDPDMYSTVFLAEHSLWKRIKLAVRYIFNSTCRYGHFQEFIFDRDNAAQLKDVLSQFLDAYSKQEDDVAEITEMHIGHDAGDEDLSNNGCRIITQDGTCYIALENGRYSRTEEVLKDCMLVDYNKNNEVFGIELLAPVKPAFIENYLSLQQREVLMPQIPAGFLA